MAIYLLVLGALVLWAVLASILRLEGDGYGRPEISNRNRRPERLLR